MKNKGVIYRCLAFDIDPTTGDEINLLWIEDSKPEKVYRDRVDHYGDIRDSYRRVQEDNYDK